MDVDKKVGYLVPSGQTEALNNNNIYSTKLIECSVDCTCYLSYGEKRVNSLSDTLSEKRLAKH